MALSDSSDFDSAAFHRRINEMLTAEKSLDTLRQEYDSLKAATHNSFLKLEEEKGKLESELQQTAIYLEQARHDYQVLEEECARQHQLWLDEKGQLLREIDNLTRLRSTSSCEPWNSLNAEATYGRFAEPTMWKTVSRDYIRSWVLSQYSSARPTEKSEIRPGLLALLEWLTVQIFELASLLNLRESDVSLLWTAHKGWFFKLQYEKDFTVTVRTPVDPNLGLPGVYLAWRSPGSTVETLDALPCCPKILASHIVPGVKLWKLQKEACQPWKTPQ